MNNNDEVLVSVIMLSYNHEKYIAKARKFIAKALTFIAKALTFFPRREKK